MTLLLFLYCSINDVGTTLWDSEIILAHYMDDLELCGKQILEIGAGTVSNSLRVNNILSSLFYKIGPVCHCGE